MHSGPSALNTTNLDESTSSSDAADVLIRSTKVALEQDRQTDEHKGMESALSCRSNVNIHVRRLSDSAHSPCLFETSEQGITKQVVPPVLHVNLSTGSEKQHHMKSDQDLGFSRRSDVSRGGRNEVKTPGIRTLDSKQKDQDVFISRYSGHGRGAVAAALKQRSHSVAARREVKVHLLDSGLSQSSQLQVPDVQPNTASLSGDAGTATNVAAITAAAIAATAPLIKAQSEIEARVAQVASELRRLQEAEGRMNRASESRLGGAPDRVAQLEEQLTVLTQQRLQHLERIQGQQLDLQNRLLGSALNVVTSHSNPPRQSTLHGDSIPTESVQKPGVKLTVVDKAAGDAGSTGVQEQRKDTPRGREKCPLETPAPRRVIPKPTCWNCTAHSSQQSSTKAHKAPKKYHGNGRLWDQISNNQKSTRWPARSDGVKRVAIATVNDSQPEHFRENPEEISSVPTGRGKAESPAGLSTELASKQHSQGSLKDGPTSLTNGSPDSLSSAVHQANAMLQDLSRLKDEMKTLIQTADAFPVRRAEPSHFTPPEPVSAPSPPPVSMPSKQGDEAVSKAIPQSTHNTLQKTHPPASMFEDAEHVLRQVRHNRQVLEENLQTILRAKDGEVLHIQLEALANNRDISKELRIKKTVDAWINTLSKEIQAELAEQASTVQTKTVERDSVVAGSSAQQDLSSRNRSTAGKEQKGASAAAKRKPSQKDSSRRQTLSTQAASQKLVPSFRSSTEQNPQASVVLKSEDDEAYLAKVYGKALYEGQRRTMKKGPYLRFGSPTPKSKVQRPKVIESVKGVKVKSCKTQTYDSAGCAATSLQQPSVSKPQYLFSPSDPVLQQQQQQPGLPLQGYLIPMAIPLGKPRVDSQAPLPSRVIISDKPAIVTTSYPSAPYSATKITPGIRKPNTVLLEVHCEQERPAPNLQIQVQPSVNIDSITAPGSSPPPSPSTSPVLPPASFQTGADAHTLNEVVEDNALPGTSFLEATDTNQEPELEEEFPAALIELNGVPSPPATLYHGPAFPTQPKHPEPLTQPVLNTIQQRETLENRLVDWVEQQLMARVINGMLPQPLQTDPANESEPENSVTSDIVEAAGGGGLQLFVDAGTPVDSELIRQCVNEVLADIIAVTLGQREAPRENSAPVPKQITHTQEESPVPTPVPTPEPSEKGSPLAQREAPSPVSTPDISEHPSPAQSPRDAQPAQPQLPTLPEPEKDPVETPISTPLSSPVRIVTPEPTSLHNNPWGDAELPLNEEKPHSEEEVQQPLPVVFSVACVEEEEEEEVAAISPVPSKTQNPPTGAEESKPLPPESPSGRESSTQSSSTITETETAARHISEGELLLSCGQMAAVRALEEEGFTLPNMMMSFNSSLHGVQDMDYDPPSEGEVIRRGLVPAHRDPILSLLARMEQSPVSQIQQPERWWDEDSSGELSEGQRPVLTEAQERVVVGHSRILQHLSNQPTVEPSSYTDLSSPGQIPTKHTGVSSAVVNEAGLSIKSRLPEERTETSRVLHSFTASPSQPGESAPQQAEETPQLIDRAAPILVKQYQDIKPAFLHQRRSSDDTDAFFDMDKGSEVPTHAGGNLSQMSVQLLPVQNDGQSLSLSTIEGDSDSVSDVF
ncbi:protein TALPID3 [Trichomycterus rosablanca]|uniref:protein TALPID3 n=1 Tax=Trichomycterus rosablanca TaxID=2290929 RepID=UPI002F35DB2F